MQRYEQRRIELDLDGDKFVNQYAIENFFDGWFDLTIWYQGMSVTERVPVYTQNPHDDVVDAHAALLLTRLLEAIMTESEIKKTERGD